MKCYVQVVTTPTADTAGTTLLIHFDDKRYLVGSLGEGTQRACMQTGNRLAKVNECFVTGRTEWQNNGGLLGMLLTLADVHTRMADEANIKPKKGRVRDDSRDGLTFISAPNLNYHIATARRFVFRKGMPVNVREVDHAISPSQEPFWQDQNIRLWALPVMPTASPRPINPRKRSFEMLEDDHNTTSIQGAQSEPRTSPTSSANTDYKNAAEGIVNDMFNSDWQFDALYETRLADVKMPAAIFVRDQATNKIEKYSGPKPGDDLPLADPDLPVFVRRPWPGAQTEFLPSARPAAEALSYIIRTHPQRGKFFPDRAKALNIKPGKDFARLTAGESVVNTDGVTIRPEQVLGPTRLGNGIAVISLPAESYIDNLITRPEWTNADLMTGVDSFFWDCGPGVLDNAKLRSFITSRPNIKHIISTAEHCSNYATFTSSTAANIKLSNLDSKRFAKPIYDEGGINPVLIGNADVTVAEVGLVVQLEPVVELSRSAIPDALKAEEVLKGISPRVRQKTDEALKKLAAATPEIEAWAKHIPGRDVEITTLGTGSALPSKYRNVSSTLVRVPGWGSLLFDAGENTLGQLRRVFPPAELEQIFSQLKVIIISHMHADHHLGMLGVVREWYKRVHGMTPSTAPLQTDHNSRLDGEKRLAILAEPAMHHWLSEYSQIEDFGYSRLAPIVLYPQGTDLRTEMKWYSASPSHKHDTAQHEHQLVLPASLGLADVQACRVNHCHGAKAVSITWPDGFKASYSGDCRPSKQFAQIGKGSTVCIHEATFDDELRGDAQAKQHSTTSEALGVAQAMGAKTCILTHFSQRYQKLPILERAHESGIEPQPEREEGEDNADEMTVETDGVAETTTYSPPARDDFGTDDFFKFKLTSDMKVGVAFDYMRVKVGEIAELQYFTEALLELFAEEAKAGDADGAQQGQEQQKQQQKQKKGQRRN